MLVSLKEVNKYVSLEGLDANGIAKALTFSGTEVEEVLPLASGTNLVIGEVVFCQDHPDSDHLHVLKVNLGPIYGEEQIVCGAPNARKGIKVIVARPGAKLPGGEIKRSTIRGVESNGMCCSLLELGVDAKYLSEYQTKGIEELPLDAPVGEENVLGYLGLDDTVLNLKVLANRPDLLSLYQVAKEIAAVFNRPVKIPSYEEVKNFSTDLVVGSETKRCSQFAGKEIRGIVTKPSPLWMSRFLMASGTRSINNIVDIGNYVMLLTGQPLHMYDADKLAKKELIARDDYDGEFVALDEKSYKVIPGDIVITSDKKPMCLGGVMGSLACAVDEHTKNIYIEAASFDGASIRHTSNRLGLASESSSRFVKGTNHFQAKEVINFAAYLIKELCEAKEFSDLKEYQVEEYHQGVIKTSAKRINNRLGTSFELKDIKDTLSRLYFEVEGNEELTVKVPQARLDVTCDADLSEEVIRLLGYQYVRSELPVIDTTLGSLTLAQNRLKEIRHYLLSVGLDECLTYSLISKKEAKAFNLLNEEEQYVILNPLTDEHEVFRTHILNSLLKVASYNIARQNKNLALFETSNMMSKASRSEHLAIVLVGNDLTRGLMSQDPYNFYHMKGLVEEIFTLLGIEKSRYKFEKQRKVVKELHPGKSADIIFQNQVIGKLGELYPTLYQEYDLGKTNAVVLELNLEPLLNAKVSLAKMETYSRFPSVNRDLALIVKKEVSAADLIKTIKVVGKGLVSDAQIFDVFEGALIGLNRKSLAISITFSSSDHTLQDKEINDVLDKIKFDLNRVYQAELRG
ncbi:MAG: phenylalanine--tRNA ligase subunit beta [Bacilli bacterium]|nr:phenylalanine--tRNA ligase subunit beta [Bacilli bacterium]